LIDKLGYLMKPKLTYQYQNKATLINFRYNRNQIIKHKQKELNLIVKQEMGY